MSAFVIPVKPVPSQKLALNLAGQDVVITLRQCGGRQLFYLSKSSVEICGGVIITDRVPIINAPYLDFQGDFISVDVSGESNPFFFEWGNRFLLVFDSKGFGND